MVAARFDEARPALIAGHPNLVSAVSTAVPLLSRAVTIVDGMLAVNRDIRVRVF